MNSVTADSVDSFIVRLITKKGEYLKEAMSYQTIASVTMHDVEWNSEEDDVISCGENDNLWEEFQQSTFWSPLCSIKQCYIYIIHRLVIMWRMKFH